MLQKGISPTEERRCIMFTDIYYFRQSQIFWERFSNNVHAWQMASRENACSNEVARSTVVCIVFILGADYLPDRIIKNIEKIEYYFELSI